MVLRKSFAKKERENSRKSGVRSSLHGLAKRLLKKSPRKPSNTLSSSTLSMPASTDESLKGKKKRAMFTKLRSQSNRQKSRQQMYQKQAANRFERSNEFSLESRSEELDKLVDHKVRDRHGEFNLMNNLESVGDLSAAFEKMLEAPPMEATRFAGNLTHSKQPTRAVVPSETTPNNRRKLSLISSNDEDDDYQLGVSDSFDMEAFEQSVEPPTQQVRVVSKGAAGLRSLMFESTAHFDWDSDNTEEAAVPLDLSESTSMYSTRSHRTKRESIKLTKLDLCFLPQLESALRAERLKEWAARFRRTDPRYQIMHYFDDVAKLGVNEITKKGKVDADKISPILKMWNRSSIFTVWRPTSMDAIRLMMKGEGVGKGLDIKGKSAKKGNISGFVPFLQIYEEHHKTQIRTLPKDSTMRIFYQTENLRTEAAQRIARVMEDMVAKYGAACEVLESLVATDEEQEAAMGMFMWELQDPEIVTIDDYAENKAYGLEVPDRVFWETYVMRQDIYREPGSEQHTGRPSEPAFQDMNFSSLRHEPQPNRPRAVVYQKDTQNAMDGRNLLMAYEENGRVLPVVSDFDCFLAGTRCVAYEAPLPDDQVELVKWGISKIESILEAEPGEASWTSRWLNVLKQDHVKPTMPQFGFGDPKSYSLMELAVERLNKDGCVRHGAECFNFYFPQELDDYFLVIGEGINDNDKGPPWKYVNVKGLQKILLQRAKEGYTFPLNPKWVLCDPGWKEIYDVLIESQASHVQESMDCWFPPGSGIREKIEEISERFPDGFVQVRSDYQRSTSDLSDGSKRGHPKDPKETDGTAAMDLAQDQLRRYQALQRAKKKLKIVLTWMSFVKKTNEAVRESQRSAQLNADADQPDMDGAITPEDDATATI